MDWDLPPVRQNDARAELNLDLRWSDSAPEHDCLERERGHNLAAIFEEQRHTDPVAATAGKIDETGCRNEPNIVVGLAFDPGERRQSAAITGYIWKRGHVIRGEVLLTPATQLDPDEQLWDTHRLVDKDLQLVLVAIAPDNDRFERDHRRLKLHDRLEEEGVLEGRERAVCRMTFWQRLRLVQWRQALEIFAPDLD